MIHSFTIPGRPKPKERPRGSKRFGGRTYTPRTTLDAQKEIAEAYEGPWFEGPLSLSLVFSPKETQVVIQTIDADNKSALRSDLDNLVKLVGDALQGVAFENDKQVHKIVAVKV